MSNEGKKLAKLVRCSEFTESAMAFDEDSEVGLHIGQTVEVLSEKGDVVEVVGLEDDESEREYPWEVLRADLEFLP